MLPVQRVFKIETEKQVQKRENRKKSPSFYEARNIVETSTPVATGKSMLLQLRFPQPVLLL